jgi:hypothetical protein
MFSNRKLVLVIVLLLTLSVTAYILIVVIPARLARQSYDGAKEIGRDIRELFHFTPEITVDNTVVLEQQTPILELATLSQTFRHEYVWTNTWMNSTKKINIRGTMEAKAGFDLNRKFIIRLTENKAYVTVPRAKLLSLEPKGDMAFSDENGIWNWVRPEDRSMAINAFTQNARTYAAKADFVQSAQKQLEEKLIAILKLHGKEVEIVYDEIPVVPESQQIIRK